MKHARKRRHIIWTIVLILVAIPVATGLYFFVFNKTVRDTVRIVATKGLPPSKAFPGKDHIDLLLLGRDIDINNKQQTLKTRGRSDTIIIMRVDFLNNQINLLSIPRDTAVHIPGYRGIRKINAAHALGGPELTAQTIQDLIGVPTDYYIVVNYKVMEQTIDQLGGVTVNVDKQLDYDDNWGNLHIHLKPGIQRLNGKQAIGFVRYRHANRGPADSDFVRMGRQQILLQAVKSQIMNPRVLLRLPGALDSIRNNLVTNMSYDQLLSLAFFIKSVPHSQLNAVSLPSGAGPVFVHMNALRAKDVVERIFGVLPNGFPTVAGPSDDELNVVNNQIIRFRKKIKKSGRHISEEQMEEMEEAIPEEATTTESTKDTTRRSSARFAPRTEEVQPVQEAPEKQAAPAPKQAPATENTAPPEPSAAPAGQ